MEKSSSISGNLTIFEEKVVFYEDLIRQAKGEPNKQNNFKKRTSRLSIVKQSISIENAVDSSEQIAKCNGREIETNIGDPNNKDGKDSSNVDDYNDLDVKAENEVQEIHNMDEVLGEQSNSEAEQARYFEVIDTDSNPTTEDCLDLSSLEIPNPQAAPKRREKRKIRYNLDGRQLVLYKGNWVLSRNLSKNLK